MSTHAEHAHASHSGKDGVPDAAPKADREPMAADYTDDDDEGGGGGGGTGPPKSGEGNGKKNKNKAKKPKLTIFEKYEMHKQFVEEMKTATERIEAEEMKAETERVEAEEKEAAEAKKAKEAEEPAEPGVEGSGDGAAEEGPAPEKPAPQAVGDWNHSAADSERKLKKVPVLPWMRVPVTIESGHGVHLDEVRGLDPRLVTALETGGFVELFPVQAATWQLTAGGLSRLHDVCVCAPTGSGKTLAYALPMVQSLGRHRSRRFRGLVIVPTRDLASQVFEVLRSLGPAAGLRCGLLAGKETEKVEGAMLMAGIDLAVATPGRLISHMRKTEGFVLSHLEILVVDEADRLLRQSYNEWLPRVMEALPARRGPLGSTAGGVLKLIVSATLTKDPSKIDRLGLHCPRYVAVSSEDYRYKLPKELKEYKVPSRGEDKPLALVALLNQLEDQQTVVFASSVEATHRLWVMLSVFKGLRQKAVEYSSHISEPQRQASLELFRSGLAKILVASDAMTRGMDVASISAVVNYDTPVYAKTYVHRAGRTARAGRNGRVFTLLRFEDLRHFKAMLRKADNTFVMDHKIADEEMEALRPHFGPALEAVRAKLEAEALGGHSAVSSGGCDDQELVRVAKMIRLQAERNAEAASERKRQAARS